MKQNVKIAKELIKLAKSLIADKKGDLKKLVSQFEGLKDELKQIDLKNDDDVEIFNQLGSIKNNGQKFLNNANQHEILSDEDYEKFNNYGYSKDSEKFIKKLQDDTSDVASRSKLKDSLDKWFDFICNTISTNYL